MSATDQSTYKMEVEWKNKIGKLLWLTWSFGLVGIDNGILGPSLLDLRSLLHVDMYQMNPIFICQGIGFIIGCIVAGLLSEKINLDMFLGVSLLLGSANNVFIPLTHSIYLMSTFFFMQGLTKGLVDVICLVICLRLFPNKRNWQMQFVTVAASLTSFIVPFIVVQFQSRPLGRIPITPNPPALEAVPSQSNSSSTPSEIQIMSPSHIEYAFFITAAIMVPPIIAFFYFFIRSGCQASVNGYETDEMNQPIVDQNKYPWEKKWKMIVLLFLFHIPIFGILLAYSNLLTSYGIASSLNFTKAELGFMTSLFWGSFLVGRILTTSFSKIIDIGILLSMNFVGLLTFAGLLVVQYNMKNDTLLWVATSGFGLFQASFLPSVISWSGSFLRVDALVVTVSLIASGLGEMTIPYITGVLFETYGYSCLVYMVLAMCLAEFVMFLLMALLNHRYEKQGQI